MANVLIRLPRLLWFFALSKLAYVGAGDVLAWMVQSPVVKGSVQKWFNQLPVPLQQQLQPYLSNRRRKLLAVSKNVGAESPGGGMKGASCGSYCYGR